MHIACLLVICATKFHYSVVKKEQPMIYVSFLAISSTLRHMYPAH